MIFLTNRNVLVHELLGGRMGDIDSTNFGPDTVREFEAAVARAEFLSIDLEMTGISFQTGVAENGGDTVAFRYRKIKEIAAAFNIIQIGVATFQADKTARVFNFYVFPRPVTEGSVDHIPLIAMCSASTNFNRSHGMDFGRWIDKGVTYVDAAVEERLRTVLLEDTGSAEKAWSRLLSSFTSLDSQTLASEEYTSQATKVMADIEAMLADDAVTSYKVPFIHGGQKYLKAILASVHEKCPQLRLVEEVSGGGSSRVISKKSSEQLFDDYVGFRKIWSVITRSNKPVVFHNGFLDLMFCFQAFEGELPDTVLEFKQRLASVFPAGVFDTRLIAIEAGLSMAGSAALETLAEMLGSSTGVTIVDSGRYDSAAMEEQKFHEAGYDALLTGKVFIGLKAKTNIEGWKNYMCISRCLWVLSIDTPDSDRLLMDCGTGKSRLVRIISDLNPKVTTRELLAAFEDLNSVVPVRVNIQWTDKSAGILMVTWTQPEDKSVDAVTTAISAKTLEIVKAATDLGENVKLATPQEYVKKQLDEISPEALMAQKRFRF